MSQQFSMTGLTQGWRLKRAENVAASPLFDAAWYLQRYADVSDAEVDPALHYVACGGAEGRWPHPLFDPDWYLPHAEKPVRPDSPLFFVK